MFALLIVTMSAGAAAQFNPDNVVRCMHEDITGSIARTRRVCHTVGEWRRINADARAEADRFIENSVIRPRSN